MSSTLQFLGATGEVTASLYVIRAGGRTVLLECGPIQGGGGDLGCRDDCRTRTDG